MLNGAMRVLLRSRLHGLASEGLALLTMTGRTSGRSYEFPVQYVERSGTLILLAGHAGTKTWWRNLRTPAPVTMRLRGRDVDGTAVVITSPAEAAEALRHYVDRFPKSRRSLQPSAAGGDAEGRDGPNVFVRVDLGRDAQAEDPRGLGPIPPAEL